MKFLMFADLHYYPGRPTRPKIQSAKLTLL